MTHDVASLTSKHLFSLPHLPPPLIHKQTMTSISWSQVSYVINRKKIQQQQPSYGEIKNRVKANMLEGEHKKILGFDNYQETFA